MYVIKFMPWKVTHDESPACYWVRNPKWDDPSEPAELHNTGRTAFPARATRFHTLAAAERTALKSIGVFSKYGTDDYGPFEYKIKWVWR